MGDIVDLGKKRKENLEAKTRQVERIFFRELIGCYSSIENGDKIFPVEILDISETGCLIEIPQSSGGLKHFELHSIVNLRLYFTPKSFIDLDARIVRSEEELNSKDVKVYKFGAQFKQYSKNYDVFKTFIDFLKKFAEHSNVDNYSKKVFFL